MKRILVTGVGGGVGQSVVKALEDTPYSVVGVDSEELAAGLHAVPQAYKGYYASDERFVDRLLEICRKESCGLIFAGHDVELFPLSKNSKTFETEGIIPVVSSKKVLDICDDKLATQNFLRENGFPVIETIPLREVTRFRKPVVLKPQRGGARARATYIARSEKELNIYRELVDPDNCVVQDYIEGDEYTCGTVTFNNKCVGSIVMRRILRDGDTYKAFVEHPSPLEPTIHKIVELLRPFGACNIQLRVKDRTPYIFEINARFSGTTAARALAGFNEPKIIADYLYSNILPTYSINNITILRYWKELVVSNDRIEALQKDHTLKGNGTKL